MIKPYKLTPAFKDVLWGGEELSKLYGKEIPSKTTGESFEASIVPGFISKTEDGDFSDLVKNTEMTGEGGFNLLFKLIDAKDKLSVQVHPDDATAKILGGERGKTECWYVVSAKEGAFLYLGFNEGVTADAFKEACYEGGMEKLLSKVPVKKGDFFFVPAKTVHAIGEGLVIAELQQSCDTTYRVYDYERRDKNGNLRDLHRMEAIASTEVAPYKGSCREKLTETRERLCKCEYFDIVKVVGTSEKEEANGKYILIFVEEGSAEITYGGGSVSAKAGDTFFIPANLGEFKVEGDFSYLLMKE